MPISYPTGGGLTPHTHSSDSDGGKLNANTTLYSGFGEDRRVWQFGT